MCFSRSYRNFNQARDAAANPNPDKRDPYALAVLAFFINIINLEDRPKIPNFQENILFEQLNNQRQSDWYELGKGQVKVLDNDVTASHSVYCNEGFDLQLNGIRGDRFYRYEGSLTEPPCTEGVTWTVFQDPINISFSQAAEYMYKLSISMPRRREIIYNNRPVQDLNDRDVFITYAVDSADNGKINRLNLKIFVLIQIAFYLLII